MNIIVGQVVIGTINPKGDKIDRDQYIAFCHENDTVFISTYDQGNIWISGVFSIRQNYSSGILCDIKFPDSISAGSIITGLQLPYNQGYLCLSVNNLEHNFKLDEEGQIKIMSSVDISNISGIILSGLKGIIRLFASSSVNINANELNEVSVNQNITTENLKTIASKSVQTIIKDYSVDKKETSIIYEKGTGFNFVDEFGNIISQDQDKMILNHTKKIEIGSENLEFATKGETLKQKITDLCNTLNTDFITHTHAQLGTPPTNSIQYTSDINTFITGLDAILSKYLKTS